MFKPKSFTSAEPDNSIPAIPPQSTLNVHSSAISSTVEEIVAPSPSLPNPSAWL